MKENADSFSGREGCGKREITLKLSLVTLALYFSISSLSRMECSYFFNSVILVYVKEVTTRVVLELRNRIARLWFWEMRSQICVMEGVWI